MEDISNDFISMMKIRISLAREDRAKAQARIDTLEEILNDYETFLVQNKNQMRNKNGN